jgi:type VI secretion system secreted protein Hcp
MAADYYLQLDGVKGESTDSRHQRWIEFTMVHCAPLGIAVEVF